jgi:hypothetical protein
MHIVTKQTEKTPTLQTLASALRYKNQKCKDVARTNAYGKTWFMV